MLCMQFETTPRRRYNAVNFLPNPHNRGEGELLWFLKFHLRSAAVIAVPMVMSW